MADKIPTANRQLVQGRALGQCERCMRFTVGELHHRRPKGMGGSSNPDRHAVSNLTLLCRDCHSWAHVNPADAAVTGFLVPRSSGLSPVEVPIRDLSSNVAYLDDEGQYRNEPEVSEP